MPLRERQSRVGVVLLAVFACDLLDLAKKSDLCFGRHATRGVVVLATYREESQMKRKTVLAAVTAIAAGVSLSGCYVVPIDPRYPAAEQPGLNAVPRPLAVPASEPVPTTLQARLYPLRHPGFRRNTPGSARSTGRSTAKVGCQPDSAVSRAPLDHAVRT